MTTLRVVAHLRAKSDKVDETKTALVSLLEPTRAEAGCIRYELMQNDSDPTDFTFVEEWSGNDSLDEHLLTEHIRKLVARADELFAAPPDIRRYTLIG
jgi:quinol monooxygenase YgiN